MTILSAKIIRRCRLEFIPNEWDIVQLGRFTKTQYGITANASDSGTIPMLGMKDLNNGKIFFNDNIQKIDIKPAEIRVYQLVEGDILFNRTNSADLVGKSAVFKINQSGPFVFASYLVRISVDKKKANSEFVCFFMNTSIGLSRLRALSTPGVSQYNINPTNLRNDFYVPLPPLNEQNSIVSIIKIWDTSITKYEQFVALKQKWFSGLLRKLLSPKNDSGKWQEASLENVAIIIKGQQFNVSDMISGGKYYVLNGGVEPSGYSDKWNTRENTITISEGGNSCGFVNFNDEKFWCGGHCYALNHIKENIDNDYLYHFLKRHEKSLMRLRVGSGLPNIQRKSIADFKILFPTLDHQKRIASGLNAVHQEITLLHKLVDQIKQQKRSLMQKLLTGQVRVKGVHA